MSAGRQPGTNPSASIVVSRLIMCSNPSAFTTKSKTPSLEAWVFCVVGPVGIETRNG